MLADAAGQEPTDGALATRADDDRVVVALARDPLDRAGRVAVGLDELGLDADLAQALLGVAELIRVDGSVVPRVAAHRHRPDGNDAHDADDGAEPVRQV